MKKSPKVPVGNIIALVAVGYLTILLVQTVKRNYDYKLQVNLLQQQVNSLQDETSALSYKISYYKTDSYKEKEARAKLGLQAPGEGVIILPRNPDATPVAASKPQPGKSNLQQWKEFLFG